MKNSESLKIKKKHRKSGVSRIFYQTKFLVIISVILSVIIWVFVSLTDTGESVKTLTNIRVNIPLSDNAEKNGLKIYSGGDQKASVSVTGNRVAMGYVSENDIYIYTPNSAATITTDGKYQLPLAARKVDSMDNFDIVSDVSPSFITVFVDYEMTVTLDIKNKVERKSSKDYYVEDSLSTDKVTVTGPQSEVSKIASAGIEGKISGKLTEKYSGDYDVMLYDSSGNVVSNSMLELSVDKVKATWNVTPIKEVPISVKLVNVPDDFDYSQYLTVSESTIKISASKDKIDSIKAIDTEPVDISTLSNKNNKLTLKLDIPSYCTNLSGIKSVDADLDFSSFKKKVLKLNVKNRHNFESASDEYSCEVTTDSISVTVIGPEYEVDQLTDSDLSCTIDLSDIKGNTGIQEHSAMIAVDSSYPDCWAYGEYQVYISITEKS